MDLTSWERATRREFVRHLLWSTPAGFSQVSLGADFEVITPHLRIYRRVVNVGVIQKNGKVLLIDSGDGDVLRTVRLWGLSTIDTVLYTHYHRDQCSSANILKRVGAKIGVPAAEKFFLAPLFSFGSTQMKSWIIDTIFVLSLWCCAKM
jgi:glyoxylase-like metal-dependent hydrolase (beta-lactamase superfamily II)